MGDRANICIQEEGKEIFFYTHWDGYKLPEILQNALKRGRGRWMDSSYLARIIFCEMIQGDVLNETGFGISSEITDNSYDILYVDMDDTKIKIGDQIWTFEEYADKLSIDSWNFKQGDSNGHS